MKIDTRLTAGRLTPKLERFFELSGEKMRALERRWNRNEGDPGVHGGWAIHFSGLD